MIQEGPLTRPFPFMSSGLHPSRAGVLGLKHEEETCRPEEDRPPPGRREEGGAQEGAEETRRARQSEEAAGRRSETRGATQARGLEHRDTAAAPAGRASAAETPACLRADGATGLGAQTPTP